LNNNTSIVAQVGNIFFYKRSKSSCNGALNSEYLIQNQLTKEANNERKMKIKKEKKLKINETYELDKPIHYRKFEG